jgi:DNA polymerase III sliding clamp (beta) subunit (PCNA family)
MTPKALLELLALPLSVAPRNSSLRMLQTLLIEDGQVTAFDCATAVKIDLREFRVFDGVNGCVDAHKLQIALSTLQPACEIVAIQSDDKLVIKGGSARRTLPMLPALDYARPAWGEPDQPLKEPKLLARALRFVRHASAQHDIRPYLNGVTAAGGDLLASDGARAAKFIDAAQACGIDAECIFPVTDLDRMISMAEQPGEFMAGIVKRNPKDARAYVMRAGIVTMQFLLVEAKAAPFDRIFPALHAPNQMTVRRSDLLSVCNGMEKIWRADSKLPSCASFNFDGTTIRIELPSDQAAETIEASGASLEFGFRPYQLGNALDALSGEEVTLSQGKQGGAIYITGSDPQTSCVVMPTKV